MPAEQQKKSNDCRSESLARQTYTLLQSNQGRHGLFGHMAKWRSLAGAVRGRVGSFADQVYPVFAMAHFGQVFGMKEALQNVAPMRERNLQTARSFRPMVVAL